jgi:hypothetical protein
MHGAAGEEIAHIPLASYTATQNGLTRNGMGARGVFVCVYVKTAGTGTITPFLSALASLSGNFSQINQNKTISVAGTYFFAWYPSDQRQPTGEAAASIHANCQQMADVILPAAFRVGFVKSDASAWEVGVSFRRID